MLAAIPAAGTVFLPQPENFAILAPLIAATLWLTARGLKGQPWAFALAGLLVGLASLARNDGFIVGAAVGLVFVWDRLGSWLRRTPARIPWRAALGCIALYLLVMGPWYVRQLATFGSISPTSSSGYALWIRTIDEWNSITAAPSLTKFLEQGWSVIATSRVLGLLAALGQFVVIIGSGILIPFFLVGSWMHRRSLDYGPFFLYAILVLLGAMLLYPLHVPGGAFIHSAIGLGPYTYILALEGVAAIVAWIARRRPNWDPKVATPLFVGVIVAFTIATAALYAIPVQAGWNATRQPRLALATELDRLGVARGRAAAVDRRRGDEVLHRARRHRHAERPAADHRSRGPGVSARVAGPGTRRHRARTRAGPARRRAPILDRTGRLHRAGGGRRGAAARAVPGLRDVGDDRCPAT